jgi:hypothetical protein
MNEVWIESNNSSSKLGAGFFCTRGKRKKEYMK